jgi:hypothetical protein
MIRDGELWTLRQRIEREFRPDTANPGTPDRGPPSAGHCAAVAAIVQAIFGGDFISTKIDGVSHWYNRVGAFDIDLTGDQFGFPPVQILRSPLYPDSRTRDPSELNEATRARARLLAERCKLTCSI